jgi:translation initiation factor IF-3
MKAAILPLFITFLLAAADLKYLSAMDLVRTRDGHRVNGDIRAPQVRLIDEDGEMQRVMSARDTWLRAQAVRLDLLEIMPMVKILEQMPRMENRQMVMVLTPR